MRTDGFTARIRSIIALKPDDAPEPLVFPCSPTDIEKATRHIQANPTARIVLSLDFDDTMILLAESQKQGKIVLNPALIEHIANLLIYIADINNVKLIVLSARPDDSDRTKFKIADTLSLFLDEVNKHIHVNHPKGIKAANVSVYCLQTAAGKEKTVAYVTKKITPHRIAMGILSGNDMSDKAVRHNTYLKIYQNMQALGIQIGRGEYSQHHALLERTNFGNKAIFVCCVLHPWLTAKYGSDFCIIHTDDNETQNRAIQGLHHPNVLTIQCHRLEPAVANPQRLMPAPPSSGRPPLAPRNHQPRSIF